LPFYLPYQQYTVRIRHYRAQPRFMIGPFDGLGFLRGSAHGRVIAPAPYCRGVGPGGFAKRQWADREGPQYPRDASAIHRRKALFRDCAQLIRRLQDNPQLSLEDPGWIRARDNLSDEALGRRALHKSLLIFGNADGERGKAKAAPLPCRSTTRSDREIRRLDKFSHGCRLHVARDAAMPARLDDRLAIGMLRADYDVNCDVAHADAMNRRESRCRVICRIDAAHEDQDSLHLAAYTRLSM
jgi:hypothetical protein